MSRPVPSPWPTLFRLTASGPPIYRRNAIEKSCRAIWREHRRVALNRERFAAKNVFNTPILPCAAAVDKNYRAATPHGPLRDAHCQARFGPGFSRFVASPLSAPGQPDTFRSINNERANAVRNSCRPHDRDWKERQS